MTEEIKQNKEKISKYKFFFEIPLYSPIKVTELDDEFDDFFDDDSEVDAYNPNGFETTYSIKIQGMRQYFDSEGEWHLENFDKYYAITLACKRKDDILRFFIFVDENMIVKVGQYPSIADLQYAEIGKKYDKVLPKQDLHDLKKAIGLMAHGAGAGSLVYLRRIFENIIWKAFESHKDTLEISEELFKAKRMDEKVNFLKNFLPSQLVEMKSIYGILSKGVHELSEDKCLVYFPALKLSIELILDQKIEEDAKIKKDSDAKKQIADITEKLNEK